MADRAAGSRFGSAVAPRTPAAPNGDALIDSCGRRIDHLRLSVTSACDLRCVYCKPLSGDEEPEGGSALTDAQRAEFVRFLHARYGVSRVRITGGEPLLYPDLVSLVDTIHREMPDLSLAITTNGRQLYHRAFDLRRAGLDRINVSLDSLDAGGYRKITGGRLDDVLGGIESARFVGFPPPRINTVVLRGVNDGGLIDLARWALSHGSEIRFLEAMPIGAAAEVNRRGFVPAARIRQRLAEHFELNPIPYAPGETSRRYQANAADCSGVIGIISPVSEPFCGSCRRIRVTADGRLFPCLLDDRSVDIRASWRDGCFEPEDADRLLRAAVAGKQPQGHQQLATMFSLGG